MKPNWNSTPNALRHRKQIHVTMSAEGIARLDALSGGAQLSRGAYLDLALEMIAELKCQCTTDGSRLHEALSEIATVHYDSGKPRNRT